MTTEERLAAMHGLLESTARQVRRLAGALDTVSGEEISDDEAIGSVSARLDDLAYELGEAMRQDRIDASLAKGAA